MEGGVNFFFERNERNPVNSLVEDRLAKLKRLGKYIERWKTGAGEEVGEAGEEEEAPGDVLEAVARIREREERLALARRKKLEKIDFTRVSLAKANLPAFVKEFYSAFKTPVSRTAELLSRFPMAADLQSLLESAGYAMNPEAFLVSVSVKALLAGITVLLATGLLGFLLGDAAIVAVSPLLAIVVIVLAAFALMFSLSMKANARARRIDRALPFALRQIATQVKAGVSFHKSIVSVANANYGVLSQEFNKLISDLERGLSTEEALTRLSNRTRSKNLKTAITQIIRAVKAGGNLSQVISDIAQDVSFETRMNIRDFTEKLNFINILFIMVAVVAPVATTIMSAILQIPLFAAGIPGYFVYASFTGIVLAMVVLLYVTKQMEPTAW